MYQNLEHVFVKMDTSSRMGYANKFVEMELFLIWLVMMET
jgi:hypothetical protein